MHSSEHAGDKLVDTVALLYKRNQRRYSTFVVCPALKMRKYELLE